MDLFFEHANNSVVEPPNQLESAPVTPPVEEADAVQNSALRQTDPNQ